MKHDFVDWRGRQIRGGVMIGWWNSTWGVTCVAAWLGWGSCLCGSGLPAAWAGAELPAIATQDPAEEVPAKASNPELQRRVRLLQRQLNADTLEQREAAEQQLLALGTQVLDYLPPETESQGPELRARLTRIRLSLEERAAGEINQPVGVQLQGEFGVAELLQALQDQTGNPPVTLPRGAEQRLAVDWSDQDFWPALDEILDRAQLSIVEESKRPQGLLLQPAVDAASRRDRASYHGAFRTSARRLQYTRDFSSSRPGQALFSLQLEWEPKLRVILLDLPLEAVELQHPTQPERRLAVGKSGQRVGFGVAHERSSSEISFALPDISAWQTPTVDMRGQFKLLVAGREETFRFENLSQALQEKRQIEKSGIKVKLEEMAYDDQLMLIKVGVEFSDAKQSLESHLGWIYQNTIELRNPQGQAFNFLTIESGGRRPQGLALIYLFDRVEDLTDWELVYRSPGMLLETQVPFELKGIPLR